MILLVMLLVVVAVSYRTLIQLWCGYFSIDPFHNRFRIGLRFRLDSGKESITRRPMYSEKMPIESIVILSKLFSA